MYHPIEDQEKHPDHYILKEVEALQTSDETFDLISKPRQTQTTVGVYLKKVKDIDTQEEALTPKVDCKKKEFSLHTGSHVLERQVIRNVGFWVDKPSIVAPLTYKLKEKYSVKVPRKVNKDQGILTRPYYLEMDYVIKMANAGLLYSDEESSESEEEPERAPDSCRPVEARKKVSPVQGQCGDKKKKKTKKKLEDSDKDHIPGIKKIPTGCQCNYYGEHNVPPEVWDSPYADPLDMIRQHEMNKVLLPFKTEVLNENYEKHPPVQFVKHHSGGKRTFPIYQISNI